MAIAKKSDSLEKDAYGKSKIERYGWVANDQPGQMMMIPKAELEVDFSYQRKPTEIKVLRMARRWSWAACGVLLVAVRPDGTKWVLDGSNRLHAALRRDDIQKMPCIVFQSLGRDFEAESFLLANTDRKPVASLDKYRTAIVAKRHTALIVNKVCSELGITVSTDHCNMPKTTRVVTAFLAIVDTEGEQGEEVLRKVLEVAVQVCSDRPISNVIVCGTYQLYKTVDGGLCERLVSRMVSVGCDELERMAAGYVAMSGKGGPGSWAKGMMEAINATLRHKFEFIRKSK